MLCKFSPPILALLMTTLAPAETPLSISGPASIPADGSPVVFALEGLPDGPLPAADWLLTAAPIAAAEISPPVALGSRRLVLFAARKPGSYTLLLVHLAASPPSIAVHRVDAGESPTPPPPPPPDPPTPPDPPPGPRWYILIYESATDGQQLARVLNSKMLRDTLTTEGHTWLAFDRNTVDRTDQAPAHLRPYINRANDRHPFLFITAVDGSILWEGSPPSDPDAVLELVPLLNQEPPRVH